MNEIKLKPCPFCGGEAHFPTVTETWIGCKSCGFETSYSEDKEWLVNTWNTRTKREKCKMNTEGCSLRFAARECNRDSERRWAGMRNFKNNIGEILEKKGITQKELANLIGATEVSMSRYVNGDRVPKATTCIQIAKALDCNVEELYTFKEEKKRVSAGMTEQEAVGYVKTLLNRVPLKLYTADGAKVYDEFSQVVTVALEKQIPKEPISRKTLDNYPYYKCPCCNHVDVDEQNYCDNCGQKLDWSRGNE